MRTVVHIIKAIGTSVVVVIVIVHDVFELGIRESATAVALSPPPIAGTIRIGHFLLDPVPGRFDVVFIDHVFELDIARAGLGLPWQILRRFGLDRGGLWWVLKPLFLLLDLRLFGLVCVVEALLFGLDGETHLLLLLLLCERDETGCDALAVGVLARLPRDQLGGRLFVGPREHLVVHHLKGVGGSDGVDCEPVEGPAETASVGIRGGVGLHVEEEVDGDGNLVGPALVARACAGLGDDLDDRHACACLVGLGVGGCEQIGLCEVLGRHESCGETQCLLRLGLASAGMLGEGERLLNTREDAGTDTSELGLGLGDGSDPVGGESGNSCDGIQFVRRGSWGC